MQDLLTQYGADIQRAANKAAAGTRIDSDDLYQELLLKLWRNGYTADAIQDKGGLRYLYVAARNLMLDMVQKLSKEHPANLSKQEEDPGLGPWLVRTRPSEDLGPAEVLELTETLGIMEEHCQEALSRLTGKQEQVARAYYQDGRSQAQIVEALGLSAGYVRKLLHDAKAKLGAEAADLALWRAYQYPEARSPYKMGGGSEALRVAIEGNRA